MELIVYSLIVAILWISSFTVLLPFLLLLKFSKTVRDKWFSFVFQNIVGPILGPIMAPNRRRAFQMLEESMKKRNSSTPLEFLEIGPGGGANFPYYPENCNLTALDMNPSFASYFAKNKEKYPRVALKKTIVAMAENMQEVQDESMDVVVCTYVLCSVVDANRALNEVRRVLKPGGKLMFLEHEAFPRSDVRRILQNLVQPLWRIYFDGCCVDRDTTGRIERAGFSDVALERNFRPVWLFVRPQILGVAIK